MKTCSVLGLLSLVCTAPWEAFGADPVPATRLPYGGSWQGTVGVAGGIPNRTRIFKQLNPGATAAQINTELVNCPQDEVVFLSAGVYNLSANVDISGSGKTLRGAVNSSGVPTTILNWTANCGLHVGDGNGWDVSDSTKYTSIGILSGANRGSTTVALATTPTALGVGQLMWISAPRGTTVTGSGWSDWLGRPFTQAVKVTAKSGNNVTFTPAINADYLSGALQISFRPASATVSLSGIENLSLRRNTGVAGHFIGFYGTDQCWAKNIKTYGVPSSTYHCYIYANYRTEIRDCDMSHMESLGSSTYIVVPVQSSGLLIVNNYFHDCPNVMPMFGMSGSAFAYNYMTEMVYNPYGFLSQIVFFHGSHNHYNLFEGNWMPRTYNDATPGSRNNVFFRNRIPGWDPSDGGKANDSFVTESHHDNLVVAGNVMGMTGEHTVYDDTGGPDGIWGVDATTRATLLRLGNWNAVDRGVRSSEALSTGDTFVTSYLYPSKPAWFGDRPWPPMDPSSPTTAVATNIPAGYRAVYGVSVPTGTKPNPPTNLRIVGQ